MRRKHLGDAGVGLFQLIGGHDVAELTLVAHQVPRGGQQVLLGAVPVGAAEACRA